MNWIDVPIGAILAAASFAGTMVGSAACGLIWLYRLEWRVSDIERKLATAAAENINVRLAKLEALVDTIVDAVNRIEEHLIRRDRD